MSTPSITPRPSAAPARALPDSTQVAPATLAAELKATLASQLTPTATPDRHGFAFYSGVEGVSAFPLDNRLDKRSLWVAYSQGMRSFDPPQNHFVAIYTRTGLLWRELGRLELSNSDYYSEWAVEQVQIDDSRVWLQVQGGAGAHGGCFDLLNFDGQALHNVLTNCTSTPLAGELRDLNQDGKLEALLNTSENYVFCYACGVRVWSYQVWRWDGEQMVEVQLTRLPRPAPEEISGINDRAVELAQAELWKDAQQSIRRAVEIDPDNQTVIWNAALINLHAEARAKGVSSNSPYPLLSRIFYGDYAGALNILRPYSPQVLFDPQTPLVKGTVAEGWEGALRDWIAIFANQALQAEPDLAAAYFLRGWSAYLVDPRNSQAKADILRAAELAPDEPLFSKSEAYLTK